MDISFHYCAVKVIALAAGFNEDDAQKIATFSQFVDDYPMDKKLDTGRVVPEFANKICVDSENRIIQTVPTGFSISGAPKPSTQRNSIVPFHFIPRLDLRHGEAYRTVPATRGDNSLMDTILGVSSTICQNSMRKSGEFSNESLIYLGTAIHIFADTYAHQEFNGFRGNLNWAKVIKATTWDDKDITSNYKICKMSPTIGHGMLGHAPDQTHIVYTMMHYREGTKDEVEMPPRSNSALFEQCGIEILKFFKEVRSEFEPTEAAKKQLKKDLEDGFKCSSADIKIVAPYWEACVTNTTFSYDPKEVFQSMVHLDQTKLPDGLTEDEAYDLLLKSPEQLREELMSQGVGELSIDSELQALLLLQEQAARAATTVTDDFLHLNCTAFDIRKLVHTGAM